MTEKNMLLFEESQLPKSKSRKIVKCEGRFHELRNYIYDEVSEIALEGRTLITKDDLNNIQFLIGSDIISRGLDRIDPYYNSKTDKLRKKPDATSGLSLIPLIETPAHTLEEGLVKEYCLLMGNNENISSNLECLRAHPVNLYSECLGREIKNIVFPGGDNLSGYLISGDIGIGTIASGGVKGGGVRSDSPFLLQVYGLQNRTEINLVALIGFWAQDNTMLVSQMQPCRNHQFPKEVPFGVGALTIAEAVARAMDFEKIMTYSARNHPIFKEHPEDWGQFGNEFVFYYDNSAKKLGYDGGRNEHHEKDLRQRH